MPLGAARFGLGGGVEDLGKLELIQTLSQTTVSEADFTSIQESTYNIHLISFRIELTGSASGVAVLRMFESGTIQTGSVYNRIEHNITTTGTYNEYAASGAIFTKFHNNTIASGDTVSGNVYIFDAGKSGSFTPISYQTVVKDGSAYRATFGGGGIAQDSTVDGIRLLIHGTSQFDIEASIYGIKES